MYISIRFRVVAVTILTLFCSFTYAPPVFGIDKQAALGNLLTNKIRYFDYERIDKLLRGLDNKSLGELEKLQKVCLRMRQTQKKNWNTLQNARHSKKAIDAFQGFWAMKRLMKLQREKEAELERIKEVENDAFYRRYGFYYYSILSRKPDQKPMIEAWETSAEYRNFREQERKILQYYHGPKGMGIEGGKFGEVIRDARNYTDPNEKQFDEIQADILRQLQNTIKCETRVAGEINNRRQGIQQQREEEERRFALRFEQQKSHYRLKVGETVTAWFSVANATLPFTVMLAAPAQGNWKGMLDNKRVSRKSPWWSYPFKFDQPGQYTVNLMLIDAHGHSQTVAVTFDVYGDPPAEEEKKEASESDKEQITKTANGGFEPIPPGTYNAYLWYDNRTCGQDCRPTSRRGTTEGGMSGSPLKWDTLPILTTVTLTAGGQVTADVDYDMPVYELMTGMTSGKKDSYKFWRYRIRLSGITDMQTGRTELSLTQGFMNWRRAKQRGPEFKYRFQTTWSGSMFYDAYRNPLISGLNAELHSLKGESGLDSNIRRRCTPHCALSHNGVWLARFYPFDQPDKLKKKYLSQPLSHMDNETRPRLLDGDIGWYGKIVSKTVTQCVKRIILNKRPKIYDCTKEQQKKAAKITRDRPEGLWYLKVLGLKAPATPPSEPEKQPTPPEKQKKESEGELVGFGLWPESPLRLKASESGAAVFQLDAVGVYAENIFDVKTLHDNRSQWAASRGLKKLDKPGQYRAPGPGTYRVRVRRQHNDGTWMSDTLTIHVTP